MQIQINIKKSASYNYLEDYVTQVRAKGRHVLTLEEIKENFHLSDKAVNQALYRLKNKKKITQIRKGIYAIISPEYSKHAMIPPALFVDDMMKALGRSYYVGLLSAAALYGAAHQQPMQFFIIIEKQPLRPINNKKLKINFYIRKKWFSGDIRKIKTDAGDISVSSPELTALDLIYYQDAVTVNRTLTVLAELVTHMKPAALNKTARRYPQITAVQRLGYLLCNELKKVQLTLSLLAYISEKKVQPVLLAVNGSKEGELNNTWKIIRNIELDQDI